VSRHNRHRPDHRRATIADEAARIMQERGLTDFRIAKEKAQERLGLRGNGPLPSNEEIEWALGVRNRVFRGDRHREYLHELRSAALDMMHSLERHRPRLVGAVLTGHATEHSTIELHLFADTAEDVSMTLHELGIRHRPIESRQKLRRDAWQVFPGYRFFAREFEFSGIVFPELHRKHAPLSPVDGRPMKRAHSDDIAQLLNATAG